MRIGDQHNARQRFLIRMETEGRLMRSCLAAFEKLRSRAIQKKISS